MANATEMSIRLAPHNAFIAVILAGVALFGSFKPDIEMFGQPSDIPLGQHNHRIAATISRAIQAVKVGVIGR